MSIATLCRTRYAALRAAAPGLAIWTRLPGLYGWLSVSVGIATADRLTWELVATLAELPLVPAVVTFVAVFLVVRRRILRCAALGLAGGLALLAARAEQVTVYGVWRHRRVETTPVVLAGRVVTVPLANENGGVRYTVRCDSLLTADGLRMLTGKLVLCYDRTPPDYGHAVLLRGIFRPPSLPPIDGAYDEYRHMLSCGIWGTLRVEGRLQGYGTCPPTMRMAQAVRQTVYAALAHVADPNRRTLLQAALLGERAIPETLRQSFDRAGISHLLAISGLHVGILIAALLAVLMVLPLSRRMTYPVVLAALWGYVLLVGPLPSLVRAALMATILLTAVWLQRPSDGLNALGVAGIVWLLLSPQSLYAPGYQLSFAATLGIILALRAAAPITERLRFSAVYLRLCANAALVSTAAFCATAPVMAYHFGRVSIYGLAANPVVVLLMTACMWFSSAGVVLQVLAPDISSVAMAGADLFLRAIVCIADFANVVPTVHLAPFSWPVLAAYVVMFAGSAVVVPRYRLRFAVLAVAAVVGAAVLSTTVRHLTAPVEILHLWDRAGRLAVVSLPNRRALLCLTSDTPPERYAWRIVNGWLNRQGAVIEAIGMPPTLAPVVLESLLNHIPCRSSQLQRQVYNLCGPVATLPTVSAGLFMKNVFGTTSAFCEADRSLSVTTGNRTLTIRPPLPIIRTADQQVHARHMSVSRSGNGITVRASAYAGHVLAGDESRGRK